MAPSIPIERAATAVSWPAILAGAVAAAALSLILFLLGTGLGLTAISPWSHNGIDAPAFGIAAIIWITVTQIMAAGMGGYLTGRLRVRWADADPDEVYFRDTAHGFLAWSIATLAIALLLTTAIGAMVNSGVQAAAHLAGGAAGAGATAAHAHDHLLGVSAPGMKAKGLKHARDGQDYYIDALFRLPAHAPAEVSADQPASGGMATQGAGHPHHAPPPRGEVKRIFAHAATQSGLPAEDSSYLAAMVASHTGLSQSEAETRVNDVTNRMQASAKEALAQAKEAADQAKKASITITLWLFVSLLMGAFTASLTATWGGRCRDA